MNSLRYLIVWIFLAGMFFDSFISALIKHEVIMVIVFIALVIADMIQALNCYDKVKVNK